MNECCSQPENRREGAGPRGLPDGEPAADVVVTHCVVCGCRHFEVAVDPLELGLKGTELK